MSLALDVTRARPSRHGWRIVTQPVRDNDVQPLFGRPGTSSGNAGTGNAVDVPMLFRGPEPAVEVMVTFRRVRASTRDFNTLGLPHIDGLLTFDLFRDFLLTLDYPARRVRIEQPRTVTNEFDVKTAQLREDIHLGQFAFPQPRIAFSARLPFANIGSRILTAFAVTFDQKHDRDCFVRPKREGSD